jgi:hypothetical protein
MKDGIEIIVRYMRLREKLGPVEIYAGGPLEPIDPD